MDKFTYTFKVEGMTYEQINERKRFMNSIVQTHENEISQMFMIADGKAHYDWRGKFKIGRESSFSRIMRYINGLVA